MITPQVTATDSHIYTRVNPLHKICCNDGYHYPSAFMKITENEGLYAIPQ
jgi:hypothetical protein